MLFGFLTPRDGMVSVCNYNTYYAYIVYSPLYSPHGWACSGHGSTHRPRPQGPQAGGGGGASGWRGSFSEWDPYKYHIQDKHK